MLKEIAIADAYGAGFEFSTEEKIKQYNDLSKYQPHDLYGFIGRYTDDTQMSIAIAQLLLSNSTWTQTQIAQAFIDCFQRDPRKGYSKGFYTLLSNVKNAEELIEVIRPNSERNGAAMRAVPLGVIKDLEALIYAATQQAKVTHNSEVGINSSCAVALAAHFGLYKKGTLTELKSFLIDQGYGDWNYSWTGSVDMNAHNTVSAAFSCLFSSQDLKNLLKKCVSLGGDTDSVSAIAVGLASCYEQYNLNLPANLIQDLDEPKYGLHYLTELDKKLILMVG
ncbi:MAG: ADP-ribosylglycohydrolase family protein [Saccharospirillaceae bacterium]|nr:ADP-ribosylglycohydrolase family protein [Pseudomonadales bacterium]NRB79617.1 ADP-ribosylglycohydrolase family protein [Saccharospirillaceae bacterium]